MRHSLPAYSTVTTAERPDKLLKSTWARKQLARLDSDSCLDRIMRRRLTKESIRQPVHISTCLMKAPLIQTETGAVRSAIGSFRPAPILNGNAPQLVTPRQLFGVRSVSPVARSRSQAGDRRLSLQ